MRTLILGALLATAAATPALAQDVAHAPFTGPHIEALAGYDRLGNTKSSSIDGVLFGVGLGFDVQAGPAIVGIEGEVSDSTARIRDTSMVPVGARETVDTDRDLYIGGRIGIAAAPATLVYVKGGYTNARLEDNFQTAGGTRQTQGATNLDGYRVGGGIEQKFNLFGPSGFVKAEYRYSNYKSANVNGDLAAKIDLDRHQGVVGVGVRF